MKLTNKSAATFPWLREKVTQTEPGILKFSGSIEVVRVGNRRQDSLMPRIAFRIAYLVLTSQSYFAGVMSGGADVQADQSL